MRINSAQDLKKAYPALMEEFNREIREEVERELLARRVSKLERGFHRVLNSKSTSRKAADRRTQDLVIQVLEEAARSKREPQQVLDDYRTLQALKRVFDS